MIMDVKLSINCPVSFQWVHRGASKRTAAYYQAHQQSTPFAPFSHILILGGGAGLHKINPIPTIFTHLASLSCILRILF